MITEPQLSTLPLPPPPLPPGTRKLKPKKGPVPTSHRPHRALAPAPGSDAPKLLFKLESPFTGSQRERSSHLLRVNTALHGRPCDYGYREMPNEEQLQTRRGSTLDPGPSGTLGPWVTRDEPTGPTRVSFPTTPPAPGPTLAGCHAKRRKITAAQ